MRDIKTLLEVLLEQYLEHEDNKVRINGLCYAIERLRSWGVFTKEEAEKLGAFIYNHRPNKSDGVDDFWWDMGITYPRVRFLKQLISEL